MQENVGRTDRIVRALASTAMIGLGLSGLFRGRRIALSVTSLLAGVVLGETAITRVCPLNAALGVDTREQRSGADGATFSRMRSDRDEPSRLFPSEEERMRIVP